MKVCTDACLFGAWAAREITLNQPEINHMMDVGAGTGLLSLMLAQKIAGNITAVELEAMAAQQAAANIRESPWADRVRLVHINISDLPPQDKFDVIISNPPFFKNALARKQDAQNAAMHSDTLSFDILLAAIQKNLAESGTAFILIPFERENELISVGRNYALFPGKICRMRQTNKHSFFRSMIQFTFREGEVDQAEISIKTDADVYSATFISLLKDYYLHL